MRNQKSMREASTAVQGGEAGEASLEGYIALLQELLKALEAGEGSVMVPVFSQYHDNFVEAFTSDQ